jgi:hypothetical protein
MSLTIAQLAPLQSRDPYLYESLVKIVQEMGTIANQTGTSGTALPAPPNIASIAVTAANGYFSVTINDPAGQAQNNLGLHYFIEYDTNPAFPNPTTIDNGPSRGAYLSLGNLTLYFRAYSQFRNSAISGKINFGGTTPTPVTGGGSAGPPPPGGGSGSGGGGGGFGTGSRNPKTPAGAKEL